MAEALSPQLLELNQEIKNLRSVVEKIQLLSEGLPVVDRNLQMIFRHLEMLEIEVCDVVEAISLHAKSNRQAAKPSKE